MPRGRIDLSRVRRSAIPLDELADVVPAQEDLDSRVLTRRAKSDLRAKNQAKASELVHRGVFETLDIVNQILNPSTKINLVEFTVPVGWVAVINRVGIFYSEPVVAMSKIFGWRIMVDGSQLPNVRTQSQEYNYSSFGDINSPMEIEALLVQGGSTVAIEIAPVSTFTDHLTMMGRLSGRLIQTSGGSIVEGGL